MKLDERYCSIKGFKDSEAKEKAAQIFNAVQGMEIDTAISLLEWCSRKLLQQKCDVTPEFLQEALE